MAVDCVETQQQRLDISAPQLSIKALTLISNDTVSEIRTNDMTDRTIQILCSAPVFIYLNLLLN